MSNLYADIAKRTGGDIYIGVVGPVRTGKSTFIKRLMEALVIPNIQDPYQRERARDELPQSGSGRTIMTAEPKFVPEEAVSICPDGTATLSVRLIDSVGYMVPGAMGATENGQDRMVTTPWFDHEIPLSQAAELGTQKVMADHCSVGIVLTTDGSVTDIPRADYLEAEERAIRDMQATGKPFVVLINSLAPAGAEAQALEDYLAQTYGVSALALDCQAMEEPQLRQLLQLLLQAFPLGRLQIYLPAWVRALEAADPLKQALYGALRREGETIGSLAQVPRALERVAQLEQICGWRVCAMDLGSGTVSAELDFAEGLFYHILSQKTGFSIENDGQLLGLLTQLARMKQRYDKIAGALEQARATGYGIVLPTAEELQMEQPEMVKKGSAYGIKLRASAPSIHLLQAPIQTEISPMVGDEQQSQELVQQLLDQYAEEPQKLWQSNIFGKSVFELVSEGLTGKLRRMPEQARGKLVGALTRIINEGANGLICLLV